MFAAHGDGVSTSIRGRAAAVAVLLVLEVVGAGATAHAVAMTPEGAAPAPASVFASSRGVAIEAARFRLDQFIAEHPAPLGDAAPAPPTICPLVTADGISSSAQSVAGARNVDLRLDVDPWSADTRSDAELRPNSAPPGTSAGSSVVWCDSTRADDGSMSRAAVFALGLTDGVTFDDLARRFGVDQDLQVRPADIGGLMTGSCLATTSASICVVLWGDNGLGLGLTLEGPPGAVTPSSSAALLASLVPKMIETLAIVRWTPPPCDIASIAAATQITLIEPPACHDGWAFGITTPCATDTGCLAVEVFHLENRGWTRNGVIDVTCAENLGRLGMTTVTAQKVAPVCDPADPANATGSNHPADSGTRVAALQIALVNQGYVLPVDSLYGPLTEAAVVDFQEGAGIIVDGIAGPQTQSTLGI